MCSVEAPLGRRVTDFYAEPARKPALLREPMSLEITSREAGRQPRGLETVRSRSSLAASSGEGSIKAARLSLMTCRDPA